MARLIPRKQIEEQQNISGSLTIQQNVDIGNDAIVSGSLFVSRSFFLGNDVNDRNEITGSVFLTGSLNIRGTLEFAGPEAILSATASNTLTSLDTQRYSGILAKDFGANVPTLYVSSTDGDDNNDGRTIQYPLRTIKRAAQLSTPGYDGRYGFDTGSIFNGYVIKVQAGTYLEDNPVILPKNTTIWGAGLRITKINAKNPEQDLFWVNSGCYIAEVTVGGLRLWPNEKEPERGFGFAFQPGAFITTSPYIQNCSQISNQENSFTELYEDIPPGGGGLYVNGDVVAPDSPLASMVLDAYTQISPNGVGCLVNGRGFIQLVSFFNNFSYYAIRVNNGGHATLNNSNISFGLYGMYASGSRLISGSGGYLEGRNRTRENYSIIVDVLNKGLEEGLPDVTIFNTAEGIKVTNLTQSLNPSATASVKESDEVVADFNLIKEIVYNGTTNFPTLLAKSSNKGYGFDSPYNILGAQQITSSVSASSADLNAISASYGVLLGIFSNGTGSYVFKQNTTDTIKYTSINPTGTSEVATNQTTASVSASFSTIVTIIEKGLSARPNLIPNTSESIRVGELVEYITGITSSLSTARNVSASFSTVYNILTNGTGSPILPIPNDHKTSFVVTDSASLFYNFSGIGNNPTITLFRGETYKFFLSASEDRGPDNYPFWIRTRKIDGIDPTWDYNNGVINNGESEGTITFTVPYNAPNKLYYVAQTKIGLSGEFNIVNSTTTSRPLIASTLTYPATINSSSLPSENVDIINAFEIISGSKPFIIDETIRYISSSWSNFVYNQASCSRDLGYIIDGVNKDLLYGGNEESIRNGFFYYQYPSQATTSQLGPTSEAIRYASRLVQRLLLSTASFVDADGNTNRYAAWEVLGDNKQFIQKETIAYLSSSWSNFYYNEASCSRDIGYIVDAVATDILYGGNERAITAGTYYYLYPSLAIVEGDGDSEGQLGQTLDGIRFAAGLSQNLIQGKTFNLASGSTATASLLLKQNKELIQNETIQFVNVAYPALKYNQDKCRRDVGYIIDAIATDLYYGGNERSVTAGRYYYDYPSIATSIQKKETIGGIRYSKIISDYVVQNLILETPRIVLNDERGVRNNKLGLTNITSSVSGTTTEQSSISSSFAIVEGIIKRGVGAIPSILAQNVPGNSWSKDIPLNVTSGSQITSSYVSPDEIGIIDRNFGVVTNIIKNGISLISAFTSSQNLTKKITSISQWSGSNAASGSVLNELSASIGQVGKIITNGLSSIQPIILNTNNNIAVTNTSIVSSTAATMAESASISSSIETVINIITNGLSVLPSYVSNVVGNIKVTGTSQYISASFSGSLEDVSFISASISKVTRIIETGNIELFAKQLYTSSVSSSNTVAAYEILKANIPFIQNETIAYLSSSWRGFEYDEVKCKRDIGLIISGAAEDLIWNANSASIVNGQYYYEYPSQATDAQINQTLDGIKYASRLAQKVIQNIVFGLPSTNKLNAQTLLVNNKQFIQNETIAYLSSSWGSFDYNESKCKRDVGYIIDNVLTDLVYGGNERTIEAGRYYFLYPSQATDSQLIQTTDGVRYASRLAQKIIVGQSFTQAETNKVNASELIRKNKELIAAEVVEYVSSSWSEVYYNEAKCKRDVGYILDAVRTDLVYGGNERSNKAGEFYYLYPSNATIGGVPSATAQLDPTITGVYYANQLVQNIVQNVQLLHPSASVIEAAELIRKNRTFIQQNTVDFTNENYPYLNYNISKCYRDVGFIVDGVITDLVYGGNERSRNSGIFYFTYPSQATDSQSDETISAINFAKDLTKLIAIGGKAIEDGFDIVAKIIESGSSVYPAIISNTENGIKKTNELQYFNNDSASLSDKLIVSASFGNVINIIDKGLSAKPTIISSSFRGVNRTGNNQITSSNTPASAEIQKVKSGFDIVIDIIGGGTGSIPVLQTNASGLIKITSQPQYSTTESISIVNKEFVDNRFNIILDIVENGTGSLPSLVKNTAGLVKITSGSQYSSSYQVSSSYFGNPINTVSASYNTIINILQNGLVAVPSVLSNTNANIRVTGTSQYISASSATNVESTFISQSISIVTDIIKNGVGSLPTITLYTASISSSNVLTAYGLLKNNIQFIQDETIAYLSSSWSTASYDETKCRRDIGLIISGAAEDLLWNANSASVVNGKFYYDYPSQAQGAQLNQTLDGIIYASQLAQKVVKNVVFNLPNSQSNAAYDLLIYNKSLIQNETIAYLSSSWSSHSYDENKCKRDVGYIIDSVATDIKWGGNERSVKSGVYYYLYPSAATGSQIEETITGIKYAKDLSDRLLRNLKLNNVNQEKIKIKEAIFNNKNFIADEVIAYVSASWNGFVYNQETCKRDVKYILDAVITDVVYGGNERSIEAGKFYYLYPSQATTTQLGPTLSGIKHAKHIVKEILNNKVFVSASISSQITYNLLVDNKELIQKETIAFVSSSWSFFNYNEASCSRDTGYIVDAVATDILYGGNERVREAGEYYYLYPSLATVGNDGDTGGQLNQTLDGIRYAKGISEKIAKNQILQTPTNSESASFDLLRKNKQLIQKETIAFLSSSWVGINNFQFNEASCSRDVAYIIDNVATDLIYGGNERSTKAGEYYYLYPSAATVTSSVSPTTDAQKGPTLDGIAFAAGLVQKVISNQELVEPTSYVQSAYSLLISNRQFIQNETIQYIDAFYPYLKYNREKCRRDVGYIVNNVATDLWYGGNQRSVIAGDYYYRYPSKATTYDQVLETVAGVEYAKAVSKAVAQNLLLSKPLFSDNTTKNIKVTSQIQYSSSLSAGISEVTNISSSFATVTQIIEGGLPALPTLVSNNENVIKVSGETQIKSAISASGNTLDIVTSSFTHIRNIIYNGEYSVPDSLVSSFNYGFELVTPTLWHITNETQITGVGAHNNQALNVSSSYGTIVNVVKNGLNVKPNLITNTSASIIVSGLTPTTSSTSASQSDVNSISSNFGVVMGIIENGVSSIPTLVNNTNAGIKVTNAVQTLGASADRLQGKLVSSSFATVVSILLYGTGSVRFVSSSLNPNNNPRINNAYNLLVSNSAFIVSESIAYMSSSWSSFYYDQSKCERDLGLIISGAAHDLLFGGNSASFVNGKFYYEYPSQATGSQLDQTVTAIKFASGMAEKVVRNIQFTNPSSTTLDAYNNLRQNKGFIQSESIAYVSSSWSNFEYNEASCSRDISYIVDAVSTDLLYGGNERSIVAGRYYYDYPSQATDSQLEPTLTGIRYAKGSSMNLVVNKQFFTPSVAVNESYDLLQQNKKYIQSESVAYVNAKYPNLDYNEDKCKRDVGYIVDAVATDLLYAGNEQSIRAGEFYYLYPSLATTNAQVIETTDAIRYAARLSENIVNNVLISVPQPILNTIGYIKTTNTSQYISSSFSGSLENVAFVSASIGIVTNIILNGTGSLPNVTLYTASISSSNVIAAYEILKANIPFIQNETIAYLSSSWSTASYDETKCRRDVGLIISGAAEDLLWNANSASVMNGKFYYIYPSQAQGAQLNQTIDGINYASRLAQNLIQNIEYVTSSAEVSASYNTLRSNKEFIKKETISFLSSSWNGFAYSQSVCERDIIHIIDAVSTDLLYGGNERSTIAGQYYYTYPSTATSTQLEPTVTAIDYASGLAKQLLQNKTFVTASNIVSSSFDLLRKNRTFIQEETMAYLTASWSTFEYDKDKCKRDVGYIVDAVATDLLYGGNERAREAGRFYFLYPSKATLLGDGDSVGQLYQTIDGIKYASRIAQKVVQNITFITASAQVSASFDLLRKNKQFIAAETIAYVSSSWSNVYYNEASCSRDVGYIVDAAATDLLYGGQERSVVAGTYYYLFPSKATNAGVPSEQNQLDPTVTGVRYAGRISGKVVLNSTFNPPSQSALNASGLLTSNSLFIQKETIAYLSSSWSGFKYNEVSCSRDIGFIIDAVKTDLVYGGNERSIEAGSTYYRIPSVAIEPSYTNNGDAGQKNQTVDGINFAKGVAEKVVLQTRLVFAPTKRREAYARLIGSKNELKQRAISYTNGAFPYLVYNEASCSRDTGIIIDSVATDLLYGGNERSVAAASSYYTGQYGSAAAVINSQKLETLETNRYLRTRAEFIAANAPLESFGSLIVATGIDYSYNGSGVTFKALPPNQGGSGQANPAFEITELGGGRIYFTSGNQDGDFRIGRGLSINQATGTLVGRTFSKSLFSLVTPFSLALQI